MRLEHRVASGSCVFCWDLVDPASVHTCAGCQALYHPECLRDELAGRCATLGCERADPALATRAPDGCLHCGSPAGGVERRVCPGCRAVYHRACLVGPLRGRCMTEGCPKVLRMSTARDEEAATPLPPGPACAVCQGALGLQPQRSCPGCGELYHRACLLERLDGRCQSWNCGKVLRVNEAFHTPLGPQVRVLCTLLALGCGLFGIAAQQPLAAIGMALLGFLAFLTHLLERPRRASDD